MIVTVSPKQLSVEGIDMSLTTAFMEFDNTVKELDSMDLTGSVVIEKGNSLDKATTIACPVCGAPKHKMCDPEKQMIHAERSVTVFAKEAKKLVGDIGQ